MPLAEFRVSAPYLSERGGPYTRQSTFAAGTQFFFVAGHGNVSRTGGSTDVHSIESGSDCCISSSSPVLRLIPALAAWK
jgi:hypothetical protein